MSRNQIILVVAILLLAGLFFFLKPKASSITTPSLKSTASSSAQPSNIKSFDLIVKNKKLVSGPETLTVTEGDTVTINITNDEPEELHLHGYDKSVDLEASKSASLTFTANLTGRFPYELEHSKTEIGAIEVQPK